jgi:dihydroorotase
VFGDRGTLKVGTAADVALLELREGSFEFLDNYNNKITGRQRLFPSGTVLAGKRFPRA